MYLCKANSKILNPIRGYLVSTDRFKSIFHLHLLLSRNGQMVICRIIGYDQTVIIRLIEMIAVSDK